MPTQAPSRCPSCGQVVSRLAVDCSHCGYQIAPVKILSYIDNTPSQPGEIIPAASSSSHRTVLFVTVILLAWITLLFLSNGDGAGFAILLAILATPVLIRGFYVAEKNRRAGTPLTVPETLGNLSISCIVVVIIAAVLAVAAFLAFFLICLASNARF